MSVIVPTADRLPVVRREHRIGRASVVLALVVVASPVAAVISSSDPQPPSRSPSVVAPPTAAAGTWMAAFLDDPDVRVAGLGEVVVAVDPGGIWPVSLLRAGTWQRLLGFPIGVQVASGVGASTDWGFVVAGVTDERTVVYQYDHRGRFLGARTLFEIQAGVVTSAGADPVVFDRDEPVGQVVGGPAFATPGVVLDAAAIGGGLVVLTDDGVVHHRAVVGSPWTEIGRGYSQLVGTDPVYAVGTTASVGIAAIPADGALDRLDGAPVGPTVGWGGRPAVYDWSTDSVWKLSADGWDRVPLWKSRGFGAGFVRMIDGAATPTVIGETERGHAVWQSGG